MNLGDAVRAAVQEHVDAEPVDASALLAGVLRRRARRRWAAPAAVAAAVALVVAGAVLLRPAGTSRAPAQPAVPAGQQAVSWHGVQVLVPASWKVDDTFCGTPQSDTVVRRGDGRDCLKKQEPGLTVLRFDELAAEPRTRGRLEAANATEPVDLAGTPARRGTLPAAEMVPGSVGRVLVVPSVSVVLVAQAPSVARADALLDTARVVDVDANGCPTRVPGTMPDGPARRAGAGAALLPGTPASVSVCQYEDRLLEASRRLPPSLVTALQTQLDGLPTGRSGRVPPRNIAPDFCPTLDDDGVLLDATYDRGPGVQVWVRDQACTDRSTTNGSAVRRATGLEVYALLHGEGLPEPTPRREPAPELGYAGLPRRQTPPVPAQRADVLARTDDPAAGRLLGVRQADGRRCLLLATSEATPPSTCDLGATLSDGSTWAGLVPDVVRAVRVSVGGRQVAVVPAYGAGAAWGQRRGWLVRLPSGEQPVFEALDGLGRTVTGALRGR